MAEPTLCRCGKPWVKWAGSKLNGHARCHYPPEKQEAFYLEWVKDPRLSLVALARREDVTVSVMKATIEQGRKLIAARGAQPQRRCA